jgi:hypothetical protein
MQDLVLEIFIPGAPQTKNRLAIQQPRLAGFIHNREDHVMMGRIILNGLMGRKPILDQLPGFGIIDAAIFDYSFRWTHEIPPYDRIDLLVNGIDRTSMP